MNLFNAGKIGMLWTGPWDIASINKDVRFGVEILPADVSHATIAGPDNWVILDNGAQNAQDAFTYLAWYTSPEVHLQYCIATSTLPMTKAETQLPEYKSVYLKKYPTMEVFVANLDNATKARPTSPATRRSRPRWARPCRRSCWGRWSRRRRSTPPSSRSTASSCRDSDPERADERASGGAGRARPGAPQPRRRSACWALTTSPAGSSSRRRWSS